MHNLLTNLITYIYAGKRGSGLEGTLSMYNVAEELGLRARLFLSKDNERLKLVKRIWPQTEFYNFLSVFDVWKMKTKIEEGWAFFSMVSPKILPLFFVLRNKKMFYFHGNYDYSYSKMKIENFLIDIIHEKLIKNASLTLVPQHIIRWQIYGKLGIKAEVFSHPTYYSLPDEIFKEKKFYFPLKDYLLYFGDVEREGKGLGVLIEAAKQTNDVKIIIAGKAKTDIRGKNIYHINKWLDESNLNYLVKNAKAIVLPYLVTSQFSGCAALAFHFRKPILVSRVPTFNKFIIENKTGWYFEPGDSIDLAEKMEEIWFDPKFSEKEIEKREKYLWRQSVSEFKHILSEIERFI